MNQNEFIKELGKMNISVDDTQLKQFNQYYELLIEWNKVMNLTAITDKEEVYLKHFYDSATLSKVIDFKGVNNFCDIGTGAGFPGIIIKILYPNLRVILVDSLNKRLNFLKEIIEKLKLSNIELVHARAEEYAINHREQFDVVTARAVSSLPILLEYCIPLVKKNGYFLAMKGNVDEELLNSSNAIKQLNCQLVQNEIFLLPKEQSKRTILKFLKINATNKKYPRKFSDMKKSPL